MKKRYFLIAILLLTLVLTILCIPSVGSAAEEITSGSCGDGLTWSLTDDGTLTISGEGIVAASADSRPWGDNLEKIKQVHIENGITSFGEGLFAEYPNLETVSIGNTLYSIPGKSFYNCKKLNRVTLNSDIHGIGTSAFEGCSSLTEFEFTGKELLYIEKNAFYECVNLERVQIPGEKIEKIREYAFYGCEKLKSFQLTDAASVNVINYVLTVFEHAFQNCVNLESISFTKNINVIRDDAFLNCKKIKDIYFDGSFAAWNSIEKGNNDFSNATVHCNKLSVVELNHFGYENGKTVMCWDPVAGAEGYCIYVSRNGKTGFIEIAKVGPDVTMYTDTLKASGRFYQIKAFRKSGDGYEYSDPSNYVWGLGGLGESSTHLRIAGKNRYETAFLAAEELKMMHGAAKFDMVIVASGLNYADALSISSYARIHKAPILLVHPETEETTLNYIRENLDQSGTVVIVGGTGAVSESFEKSIGADYDVKRLGGKNRYETNIEILKEGPEYNMNLLVCSGKDFADALSASAVADENHQVFLVGDQLTREQIGFLEQKGIDHIFIIGGTGSVSAAVEDQLEKYDQDKRIERIAGANRYETSLAVAREFFGDKADNAILAYGGNFPDGLTAAPLAGALREPIILAANNDKVINDIAKYAKEADLQKAIVFGGETLVSDANVKKIIE